MLTLNPVLDFILLSVNSHLSSEHRSECSDDTDSDRNHELIQNNSPYTFNASSSLFDIKDGAASLAKQWSCLEIAIPRITNSSIQVYPI